MVDDDSPFAKLGALVTNARAFEASIPSIPRPAIFADTTYERLQDEIKRFQDDLAQDEEVGAMMAHFGQQLTIAVESIGFRNPYLITFHGTAVPSGDRCTLVQHMGQVSLLLVALKAKDPKNPRRIGFELEEKLKKGEDE